MNLFTLIIGAENQPHVNCAQETADNLRTEGAAFFGACTVAQGSGEWEGIAEPVAVLTAYTAKGRIACEAWAARIAAKYGESCVACEHRPAPGFRIVRHAPVGHGKCPACGHHGDDCTSARARGL